jgi:molecular chaperone GrpE
MDDPETLDGEQRPDASAATAEKSAEAKAEARVAEAEDRWRRAAADLDNQRKRSVRDLEDARKQERARVASAFLPLLDDLERALEYAPDAEDPLLVGIDAVLQQAVHTLARLGYPQIDAAGAPFDPREHEVVSVERNSALPAGTVVNVVRPGYGSPGNVLRPAAVVVSAPEE